ncbi:Uncharacterized protein APZ42_003477, partial [Daphnia magna]
MCNALGSVAHAVLNELFTSLPIPEDLRRILVDIYSGNRMNFAFRKESIRIFPTANDQETYLGTPIGGKLRFRPPTDLIPNLDKIAASHLAPWKKLEIFRSHLLPSLSHHLASGRVLKDCL